MRSRRRTRTLRFHSQTDVVEWPGGRRAASAARGRGAGRGCRSGPRALVCATARRAVAVGGRRDLPLRGADGSVGGAAFVRRRTLGGVAWYRTRHHRRSDRRTLRRSRRRRRSEPQAPGAGHGRRAIDAAAGPLPSGLAKALSGVVPPARSSYPPQPEPFARMTKTAERDGVSVTKAISRRGVAPLAATTKMFGTDDRWPRTNAMRSPRGPRSGYGRQQDGARGIR